MLFHALALAAIPALALAASPTPTPTIAIYMGQIHEDNVFEASVLSKSGSATVVRMACPTETSAYECGFGEGVTLTAWGTTSMIYTQTIIEEGTTAMGVMECSYYPQPTKNAGGICTASLAGAGELDGDLVHQVSKQYTPVAVPVVAGADILTRDDTTSTQPPKSDSTSTSTTSDKSSSSSSQTNAPTADGTGSPNPSSSNTLPVQGLEGGAVHAIPSGIALVGSVGVAAAAGLLAILL